MNEINKNETLEDSPNSNDLLALLTEEQLINATEDQIHMLDKGIICTTDYRAQKRSPFDIVLDATDGFIPLWAENMVLRWTFNTASMSFFQQPQAIMSKIRGLLSDAILAWGDAAPIRFTESTDNSDFEIVVERQPNCSPQGCTLARAFFPDVGRHKLYIFPTMFQQSRKEQVDTLTHEIGHIFGLRHFFAPENETPWASVVFGEHKPFSIMNYGALSELTPTDRNDLKLLYEGVWNNQIRKINGTPIKLFRPFHYIFS